MLNNLLLIPVCQQRLRKPQSQPINLRLVIDHLNGRIHSLRSDISISKIQRKYSYSLIPLNALDDSLIAFVGNAIASEVEVKV